MKTQEYYYTAFELSKIHKVSVRHIRHLIEKLEEETTPQLLHKDHNGRWMVHEILLSRFKPVRSRTTRYYALCVDPPTHYTEADIHKIMEFVAGNMDGLEIHYTVEKKKATGKNHLHCYISCNQRKKLLRYLRLGFSDISYHPTEIFDLDSYKKYITKDGNKITTIKKN